MKTFFLLTILSAITFVGFPLCSFSQNHDNSTAITPGILTFTVKSVTNNSTYSPRNVIAIWIKDAQGNFVVSRKVMANARKVHLVKWNANSSGNVVSAITGATLPTHQTHTITWDGKNANGVLVQDGTYQIWVEYTSTNSASNGNAGPSLSVSFEKGTAIQHITPPNALYYTDIVADWVPQSVGTGDLSKAGASVSIFPNPFKKETNLNLNCDKPSQAYIAVYDAAGQKVAVLVNDSFNSGTRNYTWDGTSDSGKHLSNGIYFIQIQVNGFSETHKVMINR